MIGQSFRKLYKSKLLFIIILIVFFRQNNAKGQVVLYNRDSQSVIVRRSSPGATLGNQTSTSTTSNGSSTIPVSVRIKLKEQKNMI